MLPVITPEESGRLDAASTTPVETLMDRAGLGVALAAIEMGVGYGSRVAVLAGMGNNGGDGWVAARYLARRGVAVTVHTLGLASDEGSPARRAATAAMAENVRVVPLGDVAPDPARTQLVIDALFGVGFRGDLPGPCLPWIDAGIPVLAVDVPSGLDAATGQVTSAAFSAERCVTFHARKVGHVVGEGPTRCGSVSVVDIGLERGRAEFWICEDEDAPRPGRPRDAHKWSAGSVLVIGGSPGIGGAAMLAASSALHGGAGAATIASPGALQPVYAAMSAGVMTMPVGAGDRFTVDDVAFVAEHAGRYDVIVLGPGLGSGQDGFVRGLLDVWPGRLVLDADGINALDGPDPLVGRSGPTILTPHPGEFRRLTGVEPNHGNASTLAAKVGATVLLKGGPTFVAGDDLWAVTSGGPELATIGTGDVLAGFLAALWARGLHGEEAARSAAHWHGRSGASLASRTTVTAEALVGEIGRFAW